MDITFILSLKETSSLSQVQYSLGGKGDRMGIVPKIKISPNSQILSEKKMESIRKNKWKKFTEKKSMIFWDTDWSSNSSPKTRLLANWLKTSDFVVSVDHEVKIKEQK